MAARDALSSFFDEYYANDMLYIDFSNNHAIPVCDLRDDRRDAVLTHLLNRKCLSSPDYLSQAFSSWYPFSDMSL